MKKLCQHLNPILDLELSLGNTIDQWNEEVWETCDLDVRLKQSFHNEELEAKVHLSPIVKRCENFDPHYADTAEMEYFCETCKHALRAPFLRVNQRDYPIK